MWLKCKLHLDNYIPEKLEKGMMFIRNVFAGRDSYRELYILSKIPNVPLEEYLEEHGFPVILSIVYEGNRNDEIPVILADSSQIGWWDEGEHSDEYFDVTVKQLNIILQDFESEINLLMDDTGEELITDLFEGKCILSYPQENYEYETDFEEFTNQEEEECW